MHLYDSELYMQDVCAVASMIEVQELADASVLISGGTGMIGSFLVDALLYADKHYQANTQVYILGRNEETLFRTRKDSMTALRSMWPRWTGKVWT